MNKPSLLFVLVLTFPKFLELPCWGGVQGVASFFQEKYAIIWILRELEGGTRPSWAQPNHNVVVLVFSQTS